MSENTYNKIIHFDASKGYALFGHKIDVSMNSNFDVSKNVNFGLNQHPVNFDVFKGVTKFENKLDVGNDNNNKIIHFDVSNVMYCLSSNAISIYSTIDIVSYYWKRTPTSNRIKRRRRFYYI